ncbi:MAG: tetratricopeptide repeat protein [Verrucomicrobiota bacterium]
MTQDEFLEIKRVAIAEFKEAQFESAHEKFSELAKTEWAGARDWENLGTACFELGELKAAIAAMERARSLDPTRDEPEIYLGICHLLSGDFAKGWPAYQRVAALSRKTMDLPPKFQWKGETQLAGQTMILVDEQGFGDTVHFVRYAQPLVRAGANVVLDVSSPLRTLLAHNPQLGQMGEPKTALNPRYWSRLLALPALLGIRSGLLENRVPYISAPPGPIPDAVSDQSGLKIGVVWQGNPNHDRDFLRSIDLSKFSVIFKDCPATFFHLHHESAADEFHALDSAQELVDLSSSINDFADMARIIAQLDLVISVDSAPAHLAGAMGKPVWLLLPWMPDWRWGLEGETTPWYPTMQLFRQRERGNWDEVLARVAKSLQRWG